MSSIEDFRKLGPFEYVVGVIAFVSTVSPGVLAIWIYAPELLDHSSPAKLLLLSAAFMVPHIVFSTAVVWAVPLPQLPEHPVLRILCEWFLACMLSVFLFCLPLFACFLFGWSLRCFLWSQVVLELFLLPAAAIEARTRAKREQGKSAQ